MAFEKLAERWGYRPLPGLALVAGSKVYPTSEDRRRFYSVPVVGVDMLPGDGVDLVHDLSLPLGFKVCHVDCCSVLEHCADPFAVARNLSNALVPGGTILFSAPFCWRVHAYPSDYWRFTIEGVRQAFPLIDWQRLAYAYDGALHDEFRITKQEKALKLARLPKAEVIGWGVKL